MQIKVLLPMFTLNKDNWSTVFQNCIIDFFSFFCSDITCHLRKNLQRIEYIISECVYKWHYKCIFGSFFRR